jgi:asparagine synthase (glutamine-hydrolysing)
MCGICGIYDFRGAPVDTELLDRMTSVMAHRGPDGTGRFVAESIGLGHRRLSILDLDGGAQPMTNEDGSLQVVFNGEIFNFLELREDLRKSGHRFKTRSDTEVIVHGYEEWGTDCVQHFNGIFAFSLWDSKRRELFLARDHLGVKPLYYALLNHRFLFASEIKALIQANDCPREVDLESLGQLFSLRFVPSPRTLFRSIRKLPPGHWMRCNPNGLEVKRYWDWKPQVINPPKEGELIERYRFLLEDAVRLQLRSDVPVGLFLSSGIDSGTLLAIMKQYTSGPLHTFTIGFEEGEKTNETEDARTLARVFETNHSEMVVRSEDYEKYFDHYLWDIEEPVGNETAAAFYFVSKIAAEKVKVALTGQGADEPWAGYQRYVGIKLSQVYSRLPPFVTEAIKRFVLMLPRNERWKRGVAALDEPDLLTRFVKVYSFYSEEMREKLFQPWVKEAINAHGWDVREALRLLQSEVSHLDPLSQMLYLDTRVFLPDDLLMVNDKTSMANSIEARVPYLDYRLVEFIETLPPDLKLRGFQGKYLHKKAIEKWLPKSRIYKKKKGFANPIDQWLRVKMRSLLKDCLFSEHASVHHYFNRDYIKTLIALHERGKENYLRQLYLLISFELWHRKFIGS